MKKIIDTTISSFPELIKSGNLYVDKTAYLFSLIKGQRMYFCARPRRFGKTLTLSTLEAILSGKRDLFKGLEIDRMDYDWKAYPVVHIDMSKVSTGSPVQLEQALKDRIHAIASEYSMKLEEKSQSNFLFNDLIQSLSRIGKVVVLIDEYDNLMSDNIFNESVGEIRLILGRFFEIIKSQGDNIRFAFITGVTKYAKVSVFSKMNNLNDISMDSRYAAMFGYTEEELEANFSEYIE